MKYKLTNAEKIKKYLGLGMTVEVDYKAYNNNQFEMEKWVVVFIDDRGYLNCQSGAWISPDDIESNVLGIRPIPRKPALLEVGQRVLDVDNKDIVGIIRSVNDNATGLNYTIDFVDREHAETLVLPHYAVIPIFDEEKEQPQRVKEIRFLTDTYIENIPNEAGIKINELITAVNKLTKANKDTI